MTASDAVDAAYCRDFANETFTHDMLAWHWASMSRLLLVAMCPQPATIDPGVLSKSVRCRRTASVVLLLAVVGVVGAVHLLRWYWPGSFFHNPASGTWTALAWDFAHGELYPPVFSPLGFGGTRYMPVLFMLYGAFIRLHADPITAGVLLMQI